MNEFYTAFTVEKKLCQTPTLMLQVNLTVDNKGQVYMAKDYFKLTDASQLKITNTYAK